MHFEVISKGTSNVLFGDSSDSNLARESVKKHVHNLNRQIFVDGYPENQRKFVGVGGGTRASRNIESAFVNWNANQRIRGANTGDKLQGTEYAFQASVGSGNQEDVNLSSDGKNEIYLRYGGCNLLRIQSIHIVQFTNVYLRI